MKELSLKSKTVGEIVTNDFRTSEIFKEIGIDFCCGGNMELGDACHQKNIDINMIENKIMELEQIPQNSAQNFKEWKLDFLCDYIVNTHHHTIEKLLPQLLTYTKKIAEVHGGRHSELKDIANLFSVLADELTQHLRHEEDVLFPAIKEMLKSKNNLSREIIVSEITRMTGEHDFAGSTMDKINELSGHYTLPNDACNTYMLTFKLLQEFEDDLHIHVHIENNILYPKAMKL